MSKEEIQAAALNESQASIYKRYMHIIPRNAMNPGIYFGFVEGVNWLLKELEKDENNKTDVK